jgi:hypothetical protein
MGDRDFIPDWREEPPSSRSFRSILKWGAPGGYKHPDAKLHGVDGAPWTAWPRPRDSTRASVACY